MEAFLIIVLLMIGVAIKAPSSLFPAILSNPLTIISLILLALFLMGYVVIVISSFFKKA